MAVVRVVPVVPHDKDVPWRDREPREDIGGPLVDKGLGPGGAIDEQRPIADLREGGVRSCGSEFVARRQRMRFKQGGGVRGK